MSAWPVEIYRPFLFAIVWIWYNIPVSMGTQRTLIEELSRHKGKTVMLGVRSSFFFIGPSEEALADIEVVGMMAKACVSLVSNKGVKHVEHVDIGSRKVVKSYVRNEATLDSAEEVVILVEGSEFGAFWTRDEYLAGKRMMEASIRSVGASSPIR